MPNAMKNVFEKKKKLCKKKLILVVQIIIIIYGLSNMLSLITTEEIIKLQFQLPMFDDNDNICN